MQNKIICKASAWQPGHLVAETRAALRSLESRRRMPLPKVDFRTGALSTSRYSLIGPIFAAPLWWLGDKLGGAAGALRETQRYNAVVFGLGVIVLYVILRRHVEGRLLRAFLLLLTLASMVPFHLTQFYGEVFTAVLVAVGLSAAVLGRRAGGRIAGWGLVALGVGERPRDHRWPRAGRGPADMDQPQTALRAPAGRGGRADTRGVRAAARRSVQHRLCA